MPANLQFELFTDESVLWANKDAVNAFFESIEIDNATEDEEGVVKKLGNIPASSLPATTYLAVVTQDENGTQTTQNVPTKASYDELKAALVALLAGMKAKGHMTADS